MKNPLSLIIFLIITSICKAQDVVVADAVDKTPIPFVTVKYNETGLYTNEKGILRTDLTKTQSLELDHLGYKTLKVNTVDIQDTIFMQPDATLLNEVVLNTKGNNTIHLKPLRIRRSFGFVLGEAFEQVIVLNPKKDIAGFYVEEVTIPFNQRNIWIPKIEYLKEAKAFVRLNIYEVENNLPSTQIYRSEPIEIHAQEKDEIKLDISKLHIQLGDKGLSFGIEFLGFYDMEDNPINIENASPPYIRPTLTRRSSKSYTSTTYIKSIFENETTFKPINYFINNYHPGGIKDYDHNLRIGLKLSSPNPGK